MSQNPPYSLGGHHHDPLSSSDVQNFTQDHDSDGFAESYGIPLDPELLRSIRKEQQAIHGFEAALLYFFRDPPSLLRCLSNRRRYVVRRRPGHGDLLTKHKPSALYNLSDQIQCIEAGENVDYESEWFAHSTILDTPVSTTSTAHPAAPSTFEVNYVYESLGLSTVTKVSLPMLDGRDLGGEEDAALAVSTSLSPKAPIYTINHVSSSAAIPAADNYTSAYRSMLRNSRSGSNVGLPYDPSTLDPDPNKKKTPPIPAATLAETLTHCRYAALLSTLVRTRDTLRWHHVLFWCGLSLIIFLGLLVRLTTGAQSYSGMGQPPMFGDYEAQRHWMEITLNLPVSDWYRSTPDNDLSYWGLDYPPLSAYWALAWGAVARWWEPAMVALYSSRGYETITSKALMRWSVIVADMLFLFPATFLVSYLFYRRYRMGSRILCFLSLLQSPLLVLVDHGHFQYNGVCLGLMLYAVAAVLKRRLCLASVCFCCSFLFKQNALYYALAFFGIILGLALRVHEHPGNSYRNDLLTSTSVSTSSSGAYGANMGSADNGAVAGSTFACAPTSSSTQTREGVDEAEDGQRRRKGAREVKSVVAKDRAEDRDKVGEPVSLPRLSSLPLAPNKTVVILKNDDKDPITTVLSPEKQELRKRFHHASVLHSQSTSASAIHRADLNRTISDTTASEYLDSRKKSTFSKIPDSRGPKLTLGSVFLIARVGITVIATITTIFLPFLLWGGHPVEAVGHVLHRMFPIARGIFEDKVANFWCVSHLLIKWKTLFTHQHLALLSLALTLLFSLPACIDLILRPTSKRFVYSLVSISLAFFLFSFQVHEKTILFVVIPLNLLFLYHPRLVLMTTLIATHSCYPLFKRDGLALLYATFMFGGILFAQISTFKLSFVSQPFSYWPFSSATAKPRANFQLRQDVSPLTQGYAFVTMVMIHALPLMLPHFPRYPDLIDTIFAVHGFVSFAMCWCFITYYQICVLPSHGTLAERE